jgi:hypothetical protein
MIFLEEPMMNNQESSNLVGEEQLVLDKTTLTIDEADLVSHYCNLSRVIAGPEEVVVDFGLAVPAQHDAYLQNVKLSSRVVLNYYNAKRLALTLAATVQQYEQLYGPIELDVRQRRVPPPEQKPQ